MWTDDDTRVLPLPCTNFFFFFFFEKKRKENMFYEDETHILIPKRSLMQNTNVHISTQETNKEMC